MKTIVVCGGGYAGISFLRNFPDKQNYKFILIDRNPFHYLQPEVYSYIAHESLISDILIDLYSLSVGISKNIQFINDEVKTVDFDRNEVIGKNGSYRYDYLVLSLGGRTFFPKIDGLRKYSAGVKTVDRSMNFKQSFEKVILEKFKNEMECYLDQCKSFNIIIGGGGLSGVEIASEMAFFQREIFEYSRCIVRNTNIILVEALPTILNGLDEFIIENAYKRLKNLGVDILTNKKIVAVDKNRVFLETGESIDYDFFIWTGGLEGSSVVKNLKDVKTNKKNQLITDEFFRIKENVFAIGDCIETRNYFTNEILPPTAQISIQSGKIVAEHIFNMNSGKELVPKYPKMKGILAALGGRYAVGKVGNIYMKGLPAYVLKQFVLKSYKLPLKFISKRGYDRLLNGG